MTLKNLTLSLTPILSPGVCDGTVYNTNLIVESEVWYTYVSYEDILIPMSTGMTEPSYNGSA